AATAIGGDQQPRRSRIAGGAEFMPPAPDALDGESGGVVVDAEIDPSGVGSDVVDPVGYGLAEFGDDEVMHPDRLGLTLGPQLPPAILEVADEFLLLGIDRDRRLAGSLEGSHLGIDVLELGVAVGVAGALARLGIGLQAEAQATQQAADQLLASREASLAQRCRQMALTLAHPQQGGRGIAANRRLHQLVQGGQNPRLRLDRWLAAATRTTHPPAELLNARPQVSQATINRATRNPGCARDRNHPAVTGRACFTRSE